MRNDPAPDTIAGLKRMHAVLKWRGFPMPEAEDATGGPLSALEALTAALEERFDAAAFGADPYAEKIMGEGMPLAAFLRTAERELTARSRIAKFYNTVARRRAEAWKDAANSIIALQAEQNEA